MLGREILQPVDIMKGVGEHQDPQDPSDYVELLDNALQKVQIIARENLHGEQVLHMKWTYDLRIHHNACLGFRVHDRFANKK